MVNALEAIMIFCWGLSWPISIRKSLVSRTAKGKSLVFEIFLVLGYICGIARKFILIAQGEATDWLFYLSFVFYFINMTCVLIDIMLWFRNHKLDLEREKRS